MEISDNKSTEVTSTSNEIKEMADPFIKPEFIKPLKKKSSSSHIMPKSNELEKLKENVLVSEEGTSDKLRKERCPSQKVTENQTPIPYKEPSWSGLPTLPYGFEVIKNGQILENISLNKPYLVVGRLSNCDIMLEHPSISRFHSIIQYRSKATEEEPAGVYVYDLDSTHGTFQNKYRLQPKVYNQVKVGHILKFGGSTRIFVLQGPDEDQEPESKYTVTELIAINNERKMEVKKLDTGESESNKEDNKSTADEGIDWGMGEDAQVEDEEDEDFIPLQSSLNEELTLYDPKKTLRGWFERRGHELPDYRVEDIQPGYFRVKLQIPISDSGSRSLNCSVEHRGKKKDAVIQCALEACRMLDQRGILRQSTNESHERKKKEWSENDYYDSDEDDFLDRTGDIQRKRDFRKRSSAKGKAEEVLKYEPLKRQYDEVLASLEDLNKKLRLVEDLKKEKEKFREKDSDELEAFMSHLSTQMPDKHKRVAWKLEEVKLRKEEIRLRNLVNVALPLGLTPLKQWIPTDPIKKTANAGNSGNEEAKKRKATNSLKIHEAFSIEEEDTKPKLRKVNLDDDDDTGVAAVPYSKPSKSSKKYTKSTRVDPQPKGPLIPSPKINSDLKLLEEVKSEANLQYESKYRILNYVNQIDSESVEKCVAESDENNRILGPALPVSDITMVSSNPSTKPKQKSHKELKKKKNPFDFEEKYENWVPPENQSGDGRTSLNDKLGY